MSRSSRGSVATKARRSAEPKELIRLCEEAIKTFDPAISTVDSHAEAMLGECRDVGEHDKVFIQQVLYGCIRYKTALKAFLQLFYENNSATISRADYTKYFVLSYITFVRLEELGFPAYERIIRSQPHEKMVVYLGFVFDQDILDNLVRDQFVKVYDRQYVNEMFDANINAFREEALMLCDEIGSVQQSRSNNKRESKSLDRALLEKPPTIIKPFNLTPARPVRVPEPMKIENKVFVKPVPSNLNDRTLSVIEEERAAAKERARAMVQNKYADDTSFKLHETRDTITEVIESQEAELARLLDHKYIAKPAPDFSSKPAPVKYNTSAILREDALYKKKQEQEAKLIASFEADLRDSSEFYEWQIRRRQEDEEKVLKQVEDRRMESKASQLQARIAAEDKLLERFENALEMREMSAVIREQTEEERKEIVNANRGIVEQVINTRDRPRKAKEQIEKQNQQLSKMIRDSRQEFSEQKVKEEADEYEKKYDRVQQQKALERVPKKVVKVFDPTETMGHGFLNEMSMAEAKERLRINEAMDKEEREYRYDKIVTDKTKNQEKMEERIRSIRAARSSAGAANRHARERKKQLEFEHQQKTEQARYEAQVALAKRLADIREGRVKEIQDQYDYEDRIRAKNALLGAAKEMVEANVYRELLSGAEREVQYKQNTRKTDANRRRMIMSEANDQRAKNRDEAVAEQSEIDTMKRIEFEEARTNTQLKKSAMAKEKKLNAQDMFQKYHDAVAKQKTRNPYATHIASDFPVDILQRMSRQQLGRFFEGKPRALERAYQSICDNGDSLGSNASREQALDAIYAAINN